MMSMDTEREALTQIAKIDGAVQQKPQKKNKTKHEPERKDHKFLMNTQNENADLNSVSSPKTVIDDKNNQKSTFNLSVNEKERRSIPADNNTSQEQDHQTAADFQRLANQGYSASQNDSFDQYSDYNRQMLTQDPQMMQKHDPINLNDIQEIDVGDDEKMRLLIDKNNESEEMQYQSVQLRKQIEVMSQNPNSICSPQTGYQNSKSKSIVKQQIAAQSKQ